MVHKKADNKADEAAGFWLHGMTQILLGHEDLISGVRKELKQLMIEVGTVKDFLKKEAQMLRKVQLKEMNLESLLKEVAFDVEDAIESTSTKMAATMAKSKCFREFLIRGHARTLQTTIESIKSQRLEPITRSIPTYIRMGIQQTRSMKTDHQYFVQIHPEKLNEEPEKSVGFEDETETLISSLMAETEEVDVIAITGMAGIGKTTLASKIFHDSRIREKFPTRIWVEDFRRKELCLDILKQCMTEIPQESCVKDSSNHILSYFSHMNDDDLERAVTNSLKTTKYLLVMDDVWQVESLNTVKKLLPKTGKVLITSRDNRITERPHVLRFLNREESWELLQLKVFGKLDACPETLDSIGQGIAQDCDGLPLAIVAVAKILGETSSTKVDDNTQWWWESVSQNVKMRVAEQRNVLERLESSYVELPQHMQECFLYLGVFPEGHEIPVRTLIRLWIAEGLLRDKLGSILETSAGQILEETAEKYLRDLIDRNLVMVGKSYPNGHIMTCRLHILIYAFCKSKAADKQDLYQEIKITGDRPISPSPKCHRLCIDSHLSVFLASTSKGKHVRSILCLKEKEEVVLDDKDSSRIHECFKLLRVLDCSHAKFTRFPTTLSKLIHLRYISLSCDEIRAIPQSVSLLLFLETLVVHTKSASVQLEANIWSMFQLRHLVTKAAIVLATPGNGEAGKNLQTLTRLAPACCTEDVFTRAPNLKTLGIRGNLDDFAEAESLRKLERLENLKLINEPAKEIQRNLDCLPLNIKRLTLSGTHLKWESMSTLGKIESLEILKLKNNAFVGGSWRSTKSDGFGRLGFLLIGTTDLESWEASDDCFPSLKRLVINNYEKLQKFPSFPSHKHLVINNCEKLQKVPILALPKTPDPLDVERYQKPQASRPKKESSIGSGENARRIGCRKVSESAGESAKEIKQEIARRQCRTTKASLWRWRHVQVSAQGAQERAGSMHRGCGIGGQVQRRGARTASKTPSWML